MENVTDNIAKTFLVLEQILISRENSGKAPIDFNGLKDFVLIFIFYFF